MPTTRAVSRDIVIASPPAEIFAVLTDPRQHPVIDGSGSVKQAIRGPDRLELGSTFGMRMHLLAPYAIRNTVVEHEPDRRIAWRHWGGHRWRYQLEPVEGGTRVTETFDWSTARLPLLLDHSPFPARNATGIAATLQRLKRLVETGSADEAAAPAVS
jgi:uncharacterized protein YndB with AHSA1/START domain